MDSGTDSAERFERLANVYKANPLKAQSLLLGNKRLDIQGLRAIAVIGVVAFHAEHIFPGGFLGVDVFFTVSGFVIARVLLLEWTGTGHFSFRRFYFRRFKRLTPALALVVIFVSIVQVPILSPLGVQQISLNTALGALGITSNIVIAINSNSYFDVSGHLNPLLHTWSLGVEEQFYLVLPLLLILAWRVSRNRSNMRRTDQYMLLISFGISFILCLLGSHQTILSNLRPEILGFYSPVVRVWEFIIGVAVAIAVNNSRRTLPIGWTRALSWLGLFGLFTSFFILNQTLVFPGLLSVIPTLSTAVLLLVGTHGSGSVQTFLSNRILTTIGDRSYSIYLWHWPLLVLAEAIAPNSGFIKLCAITLAIYAAFLSYRYVERPLRLKTMNLKQGVIFISVTLMLPVVVIASINGALERGFWIPEVVDFQHSINSWHIATTVGCDSAEPLAPNYVPACNWGENRNKPRIYLLGDSHAAHLSEGILLAGEEIGSPVTIATANACPFWGETISAKKWGPMWNKQCNSYNENSVEWLIQQAPGVVVISSALGYWNDQDYQFSNPKHQSLDSPLKGIQIEEQGLKRIINLLTEHHHKVVLVQDVISSGWDPSICNIQELIRHGCQKSVDLASISSNQMAERSLLKKLSSNPGVFTLDPSEILCPLGVCSSQLNGKQIFRDSDHLTVWASTYLAPLFKEGFTRALAS